MDTEVVPVDEADVCTAGVVTGGNELAQDWQCGGRAKIPSVSRVVVGARQRDNEATPYSPRRWVTGYVWMIPLLRSLKNFFSLPVNFP